MNIEGRAEVGLGRCQADEQRANGNLQQAYTMYRPGQPDKPSHSETNKISVCDLFLGKGKSSMVTAAIQRLVICTGLLALQVFAVWVHWQNAS